MIDVGRSVTISSGKVVLTHRLNGGSQNQPIWGIKFFDSESSLTVDGSGSLVIDLESDYAYSAGVGQRVASTTLNFNTSGEVSLKADNPINNDPVAPFYFNMGYTMNIAGTGTYSFEGDPGVSASGSVFQVDSITSNIGVTYPAGYTLNAEGRLLDTEGTMVAGYSTPKVVLGPVTPITTYDVTITPMTDGTVTASKTTGVAAGETITLTVAPEPNMQLKDGTLKVMQGTTPVSVTDNKFTMPAGDVTVSAEFEELPPLATHSISFTCDSTQGTCVSDKTTYNYGDRATITITALTGYVIDKIDISGHGELGVFSGSPKAVIDDIEMDRDYTVTATFKVKNASTTYNITVYNPVNYGADGTATASADSAQLGETITVTVTPNAGKRLKSLTWNKAEEPTVSNDITTSKSFTMPDTAVHIFVEFEDSTVQQHTLTMNCGNPGEGVCTPVTGQYDETHALSYSITANAGYVIDTLNDGGGATSAYSGASQMSGTLDFDVDRTMTATFKVKDAATTYSIYVSDPSNGDLLINGGVFSTATAGETVTPTITPDANYQLKRSYYITMSDNVEHNFTTNFTMPADAVTIKVEFESTAAPVTVTGMTVTSEPTKTSYIAGEQLDMFGLVVELAKSDGTTESVAFGDFGALGITTSPVQGATLTTSNNSIVITHTASSKSTTQAIAVTEPTPATYTVSFSVCDTTKGDCTVDPEEISYASGAKVDLYVTPKAGYEIDAITINGASETVANRANWTKIIYPTANQDIQATFRTVTPPIVTVTGVTVKTAPTKTSYTTGDALDLTGLVVTLTKSDASTEDVNFTDFAAKGLTTLPVNGATLATTDTVVTIAHTDSGKSVTQAITVTDLSTPTYTVTKNCGTNGTCSINPNKSTYTSGENLTLTATAGTGYVIDTFTVDGTSLGGAGLATFTGTHTVSGDHAFAVTFKAAPVVTVTGVTVKTTPTKTSYTTGDALDLTGLVVTLTKSDASTEDVNFTDFAAKGLTTLPVNGATLATTDTVVTIAHTDSGKSVTQAITVTDLVITTYDVTITAMTNGSVAANKTTGIAAGEEVTLTVTPNSGYQLKSGTLKVMQGTTPITVTDNKFTMPTGGVTVSAEFEVIPTPPLTLFTDKVSVKQNEQLKITLENADSYNGKTVVFYLNSDPIRLGEATVTDGIATFTAMVPCSVTAGDHTVTAEIDGVVVGTPLAVTVLVGPTCPAVVPGTGIKSNQFVWTIIAGISTLLAGIGLLNYRRQHNN